MLRTTVYAGYLTFALCGAVGLVGCQDTDDKRSPDSAAAVDPGESSAEARDRAAERSMSEDGADAAVQGPATSTPDETGAAQETTGLYSAEPGPAGDETASE